MSRLFSADNLVPPPFVHRLRQVLEDAHQALHASALGLIELDAKDGRVTPTWRGCVPQSFTPDAMSLDVFQQLVNGPATHLASRAELALLGAAFFDCGATSLVALPVTPRLHAGPDALLVVVHDRERIDSSALSELAHCLERGLSADRRSRLAEAVFRAVQKAADPIELTDRDARLLYANEAWERTFGYAASEVVGQTVGRLFRDPVAPIHDPAFYQFTLATLAEGHSWGGALACRTRTGERVFCEPMVSPFAAGEHGFTGNFAVRRTLEHRAKREAALAVAHHEFRTVLSAIPDGVAVLRDGRIYFANDAFLATLHRERADVIGSIYADLIHPDDRAQFLREHEHQVTRVRMLRDGGSARCVEISTAGAVSFEGKPAMILLSRDVTDQQVSEEQLARAEKLSALGALAAGVAHEINNPLSYVLLNLRYVHDENVLQGPALDGLREAIDGAKRIQHIVQELRGYSGSDAQGVPEPVDVARAVTSAINIAQNEIRHRARLERSHESHLFVLAREGQLVQVLVNLLVNAAHAIPASEGRRHVIRVRSFPASDTTVVLEVSDTGVGIAPEMLPRVFDSFSTSKRRGEGSGLGLAISKRIIEGLGGRIHVSSHIGHGTTMRIELPRGHRKPADGFATSAGANALESHGRKRLRLLVVDDESTVARALRRVLSPYEVTVARDARQAIRLLRGGDSFDVILCDLMMPGVPGPELYRRASRSNPELASRFVFMTGGVFTPSSREFLESTRCPILTKPFSAANVCEVVERVVGQTTQ